MANTDLRAETARVITPDRFPPAAAGLIAGRMLNRHSPGEIAQAIEVLIDLLDIIGGDPDLEEGGDDEDRAADGDTQDVAYPEWTSLRSRERAKGNPVMPNEDDEQDDFDEDSFDQEFVEEREVEEDIEFTRQPAVWPGEAATE